MGMERQKGRSKVSERFGKEEYECRVQMKGWDILVFREDGVWNEHSVDF